MRPTALIMSIFISDILGHFFIEAKLFAWTFDYLSISFARAELDYDLSRLYTGLDKK